MFIFFSSALIVCKFNVIFVHLTLLHAFSGSLT